MNPYTIFVLVIVCTIQNSVTYSINTPNKEETVTTSLPFVTENEEIRYIEFDSSCNQTESQAIDDVNTPCKDYEIDISGGDATPTVAYLYDADTNDCYAVNETHNKGPCGNNMKFYARQDNNKYGVCDCDQGYPTIYDEVTEQCHRLFHQDICDPGQWLIVENRRHQCKPDPCLSFRNKNPSVIELPVVYFNGTCFKLGDECGDVKSIQLTKDFQLTCDYRRLWSISTFGSGLTIPTLSCAEGTRWSSLTNNCKKTMSFTFS